MGAAAGFGQFLGAAMQADAADAATRAQADAARNAQNQQWSMYQQQRQDASPWRNTGGAAMQQLGWLMGLSGGGMGGGSQATGGQPSGYVDKNGNVVYANGLSVTNQRALQSGTIGNPIQTIGWLKSNGIEITADKLQDPKALQDAYDQVMKKQGFSQIGGGSGSGAASGFQGNPNDFGLFNKSFGMSDFQADPGYQFRMDEAMKALNRSAASRGQLFSGGTLKDLQNYSQGLASQEYGNAYNRFNNDRSQRFNQLAALAGIGQTANGQLMQGGMNAANQMGNAGMMGANAQAAGAVAQGNIWGNFANNMGKSWQEWATLQQKKKDSSGSSGGYNTNWSNGYMDNNGNWVDG